MATSRLQFRSRLVLLTAILCSTGLPRGPALAQEQVGQVAVVLGRVLDTESGEPVNYEARLAMRPIELAPLEVTVARRSLSPMLQGFYERMSLGRGHFITRADIEQRQPGRVSQMIGDIGGVRVRMEGASSRFYVEFSRHRGCPPAVYLDRMLLNPGGSERATIDDYVIPAEVEAVEVYDSPASLPAEFGGSRAGCGVIVIWTTRGM